jgi:dUTP pyrophosphatase
MEVKIVNKSPHPLPAYATDFSAGLDLMAFLSEDVVLPPMQRSLIPTGLYLELPVGYEAQIRPRSGLAINYGIGIVNSPGTIDADYRGEIRVILINYSNENFTIRNGDRICQMVITQFEQVQFTPVDSLTSTSRGDGGFGSTGH